MDPKTTRELVEPTWDETIVPELVEYVKIPNKSPHFDEHWEQNGHMAQAVALIEKWCRAQPIEGLRVEVVQLPGRTPLIYMEIPGEGDDTVLLYGHLDKQPEMEGWSEGLGPWKPVLRGDKLYGRGGADDGYAAFASLTAIRAVREQRAPHSRCVVLIEGCEESGSYDLPAYIDHLAERIGTPSLVICLDSGCGNYEQLWFTTSLRGMVAGTLKAEVLHEGVHSGDASGIVPSSFRVLRQLLDRVEDPITGKLRVDACEVEIPAQRVEQAKQAAAVLGDEVFTKFPFVEGAEPMARELHELILNRTWRATLSVTGAGGIPTLQNAGNVLRPHSALKLSFRIPPTANPDAVREEVARKLTADPPYGARITFDSDQGADGWDAPPLASWLAESSSAASQAFFGKDAVAMGEGGTIPFMGMLGEKFPNAQFMITGVLGPNSNAHGPNEFLHIPMGKKLTSCVAHVLADHYQAVGR